MITGTCTEGTPHSPAPTCTSDLPQPSPAGSGGLPHFLKLCCFISFQSQHAQISHGQQMGVAAALPSPRPAILAPPPQGLPHQAGLPSLASRVITTSLTARPEQSWSLRLCP